MSNIGTTSSTTGGTILQRRGSNQNLTLTVLDGHAQPNHCSVGAALPRHGLALSASNHSLTTMRGSHCSLQQIAGTPTTTIATAAATATEPQLVAAQRKPNLLQRRGSNTSLTLSIRGCGGGSGSGGGGGGGGSMTSLNRYNSHSSLNYAMAGGGGRVQATLMSKSSSSTATNALLAANQSATHVVTHATIGGGGGLGARRGLLDRRNSNASLTLNIGGGGGPGGGGGGIGGGAGGACGAACANGRGLSVSNCNLRSSELSLAGSSGALEVGGSTTP